METGLLCSPGWPRTHYVDQVGLKFRDPYASVFCVLELKTCSVIPGFYVFWCPLPLKPLLCLFICLQVILLFYMFEYVHSSAGVCRCQRCQIPVLTGGCDLPDMVLGTEFGSSARAVCTLDCWLMCPAPILILFYIQKFIYFIFLFYSHNKCYHIVNWK